MILRLTYKEIQSLIENRFRIKPEIIFVDENTVDVQPAGITISAVECADNRVVLSYQCGLLRMMLISAIKSFLESKLPEGIEFNTSEKRIYVDLKKIDSFKNALNHLEVTSLKADQDALNLEAVLKIK